MLWNKCMQIKWNYEFGVEEYLLKLRERWEVIKKEGGQYGHVKAAEKIISIVPAQIKNWVELVLKELVKYVSEEDDLFDAFISDTLGIWRDLVYGEGEETQLDDDNARRAPCNRPTFVQELTQALRQAIPQNAPPPRNEGHWWQSLARVMTAERRRNLTWAKFKNLILEKFFPRAYRKQKELELINLRQGSMTVMEYERKFNQLSRYALHLVDTEEKKASNFEYGLRSEIAGILAAQGTIATYSEVVERAQAVASRLNLENSVSRHPTNHEKRHGMRVIGATKKDTALNCPKLQQRNFPRRENAERRGNNERGGNVGRGENTERGENARGRGNARAYAMNREE
ncbi:hypothetical protein C2S52_007679 [Perilla frutescens var. hirtella]|nr:hypothetical protein C2S52_007679 [Perilla frutescens var. hirtella]